MLNIEYILDKYTLNISCYNLIIKLEITLLQHEMFNLIT